MECAFCDQQDVKDRTFLDNGLAFAFLTYTPVLPGHTLISPRRHVRTYSELTRDEREAMEELRIKLHGALERVYRADGFNYGWNEGESAGQEVNHLHLHVVPRTKEASPTDEPQKYLYAWRPDRPEVPQAELQRLSSVIQAALDTN